MGKAYRIDKLFGGIQEFDPALGWIAAQLQAVPPRQAAATPGSPEVATQAVPMHMPAARPGEVLPPSVAATPKELPISASRGEKEIPSSSPEAI